MDEEINNDPDLEENSIDPFNSDESEIDDSGPEDDPPVQRMVDLLLYEIFVKSILLPKINFLLLIQRSKDDLMKIHLHHGQI